MKVAVLFALLSLAVAVPTQQQRKRYDGYKVIAATPTTRQGVLYLRQLIHDNELDFWSLPGGVNQRVDIMTPPTRYSKLLLRLLKAGMKVALINNNVQEKVDAEYARLIAKPQAVNLDDFNTYADIISWLDGLQCASGLTCTNENIGSTTEGRELRLFKVSTGAGKKIIWIDSNIHAREWIAPATNLKIINNIVTNYGSDTAVTNLLNKYDFYFVPMMNPDGYIYSMDSERYWRKNRGSNPGSDCVGTDLNRNYDTGYWAQDGTSSNPCRDTYGGSSAASEVETKALQTRISQLGSNIRALISMHSYAYVWIHPFGHTTDGFECALPDNSARLSAAASAAANAASNTGGGTWGSGTVCDTINYAASGGTMDYAMGPAGIEYAFTPELRGQDFVIDASEIEPSFRETWAAIQAAISSIEGSEV